MKEKEKSLGGYYRILVATSVVSCAFSMLVGMQMVSSLMTIRSSSPLNMLEIDRLRAAVKENPADDGLKNKIRDLDVVSRRFYFAGVISLRTGSFLLLGGVVIMLISLKTVSNLRRRLPNPLEYAARPDELQSAATARWVTVGVWVALFTGAVTLGVMQGVIPGSFISSEKNGEKPVQIADPATIASPAAAEILKNWPGFRGPYSAGVSAFTNVPASWDVKSGKGVLWKVKVPLPGMSSPVVWGNRVFLTGATEEKREVYCYDIATGTMLWKADVDAVPGNTNRVPKVNKDTGFAAPTPVVDGVNIYAVFANGDIAAIDFCSRKLWTITLGVPDNKYGFSASPVLHKGRLIIQYDGGAKSELIAINAANGKKVWSVARPVTESWPTPIIAETGKGPQVVTVANEWIISYDPEAGRELWRVKCRGSEVAPTPVFSEGLVLASVTAHQIFAIRPDGLGDVTKTAMVWKSEDGVSDVPSPVSNGELVYFVNSVGTVTCMEVATGKIVWDKVLEGEFYASPGLAGDRLYLLARSGEVFILKAGRKYEEVAKLTLGEPTDCSPAFADGRIFMRGITTLFCFGEK